MATTSCAVLSYDGRKYIETLTLVLQAEYPGDDGEAVEVSSRLIQPFMAATVEMTQCREDGEGSA